MNPDRVEDLRAQVEELKRDKRIPPWKTPEGRARRALLRRRKAQRQARKTQRVR